MEIQTSVAQADFRLEVESTKGDFVSTKRCWTLAKSCGSQSSEWEERKKIRAKRGSLCARRTSRKTVTCHGLRVVDPVYHQALLRGRWRSWAITAAKHPTKTRKWSKLDHVLERNKMEQVTVPSRALLEEQPEHLTLTELYA